MLKRVTRLVAALLVLCTSAAWGADPPDERDPPRTVSKPGQIVTRSYLANSASSWIWKKAGLVKSTINYAYPGAAPGRAAPSHGWRTVASSGRFSPRAHTRCLVALGNAHVRDSNSEDTAYTMGGNLYVDDALIDAGGTYRQVQQNATSVVSWITADHKLVESRWNSATGDPNCLD